MTFELYPDAKGEWRWRLKAANGRVIACSGEGYARKRDCFRAIRVVRGCRAAAEVVL